MSYVKLAYVILAHDRVDRLLSLINELRRDDPNGEIIVHYDRCGARAGFRHLSLRTANSARIHLLRGKARVRCYWGGFGIVQATLNALQYGLRHAPSCTHYYLLSGACFPLRPLDELKSYLARRPVQAFIECQNSRWILAGMAEDRYRYHHWLNFRRHPQLFRWSYRLQRHFGLRRRLPEPLGNIRFGSQWWCLPVGLIRQIIEFALRSPACVMFFKTVWIPDECFFPTLVYFLAKNGSIAEHSLTHYRFNEQGRPEEFNLVAAKRLNVPDRFFIRKYIPQDKRCATDD